MSIYFFSRNFPAILYSIVWILTLSMYIFNPYNYNTISYYTYIIIFLSISSVLLGFVLSLLYYQKSEIILFKKKDIFNKGAYRFNKQKILILLRITILVTIIGMAFQLIVLCDLANGFLKYFKNPIIARQLYVGSIGKVKTGWDLFHSLSNYLLDFNYLGSILGGMLFALKKKKKIGTIIPLILAFLISVMTFQRYFFVNCFIIWLFSSIILTNLVSINKQRIIIRRFFKIAVSIFLFFFVFSFILISIRVSIGKTDVKLNDIGEKIVESNYSYVAGNVPALDNYLNKKNKLYYGGSLFKNIYKWIARFGLINEDQVLKGNYTFTSIGKMKTVNTYSYLRVFYEDFGLIGVIILSFLWAGIGNILYLSLYSKFSLMKMYLASVFLFSYFLSFYGFSLGNIPLHIYLIIVIYMFENIIFKQKEIYLKI